MQIAGFPIDQLFVLPIAIIAFLLLLTVIVFFHEYGHFSVARLLGVRVDVFSIGFGKPIARWVDRKGTEWRIAMLPFGGYVKFFGDAGPASDASEDVAQEQSSPKDAPPQENAMATTQFPRPGSEEQIGRGMTPEEKAACFHFKPLWRRAAIVAAGPFANFLLATAIFWALLVILGNGYREPIVGEVTPESAAAEAGFQPGDRILRINGKEITTFSDIRIEVILASGEPLTFEVERAGRAETLVATPRRQEAVDAYGNKIRVGVLGVRSKRDAYQFERVGPLPALGQAAASVGEIITTTVKFLGRLILGKEDASTLGGPIKMAQYAGQSALSGFDDSAYAEELPVLTKLKVSLVNWITLAAFVSVSIGFLNLLPVPVLDGGHLMYYAYEAIAGKPLGPRAQAIGFRLGLVMLASLMIFVTWNDINSLIINRS